MSEKYNAALGAYELIAKGKEPLILGIGTFPPKIKKKNK